jgi:hypothetical protein
VRPSLIAYFSPFTEDIVMGNDGRGLASPDWAQVYEETNVLLNDLNASIISLIESKGYHAAVPGRHRFCLG